MTRKPRHSYEVISTDVTLADVGQSGLILIDTNGELDFGLRLNRDTLERLRIQIAHALNDQAQRAAAKKEA